MKKVFLSIFLFINVFIYSEIDFKSFKDKESSPVSESYMEYQNLKEKNNLKKDEFETNQEFNQRLNNSKELNDFMNKVYLFNFNDMNMKVYKYDSEKKNWTIDIPANFKKYYKYDLDYLGFLSVYISELYLNKNINFSFSMNSLDAKNNSPLYVQLIYKLKDFSDNSIFQNNGVEKIITSDNKENYVTVHRNGMTVRVVGVNIWDKNREKLLFFKEFK